MVTHRLPLARAAKLPNSSLTRSRAFWVASNSITTSPMSSAASRWVSSPSSATVLAFLSRARLMLDSSLSSTLRLDVEAVVLDRVEAFFVRCAFAGCPDSLGADPLTFRVPAHALCQSAIRHEMVVNLPELLHVACAFVHSMQDFPATPWQGSPFPAHWSHLPCDTAGYVRCIFWKLKSIMEAENDHLPPS